MAVLLLFITLLVGATCKNVPKKDYLPTLAQLDMIFGSAPTKSQPPKNSSAMIFESPHKKDNKSENKTDKLNMNSRINVNDSDKLSAVGGKVDKKFNSTDDGDTNMKGNSKDTPKTGILDDRMALGAASCVGGVRAGNKCIQGV